MIPEEFKEYNKYTVFDTRLKVGCQALLDGRHVVQVKRLDILFSTVCTTESTWDVMKTRLVWQMDGD